MFELFRKYSGIAFVVLILLFIGLIFMVDGVSRGGMGSGPKVMSLDGRDYTYSEVEKQGSDYYNMLMSLLSGGFNGGNEELAPYMMTVARYNPYTGQGIEAADFYANRVLLGKLSKEYGVVAGEEQVTKFIKEKLFADDQGDFDQAGYTEFIEKRVTRYGLGVQDFNTLVGEILSFSQLQKIVGSGYVINEEMIRRTAQINQQEMTYEQYTLPLKKLKAAIQVTDEELKGYWEINKGKYLTKPEAKVQYVVADANIVKKELKGKKKLIDEAKAAGKSEAEIEKITFTLPAEEKTKLINEAGTKVDNLFVSVQNAEGADFVKEAEAIGLKVKTSEFFTQDSAPYEFKIGQGQNPAAIAMTLPGIPDSMESLSDVYTIGEGRFLIFQVIEKKEAEPLPYEKAEASAKVDLIDEKAAESLEGEVEKLVAQIEEASKSGKEKQKAKQLGFAYAKRSDINLTTQIEGEKAPHVLFQAATEVATKAFSKPIIQDDAGEGVSRAVVVRPISRQYVESEENKNIVDYQVKAGAGLLDRIAFENWFNNQIQAAGYKKY